MEAKTKTQTRRERIIEILSHPDADYLTQRDFAKIFKINAGIVSELLHDLVLEGKVKVNKTFLPYRYSLPERAARATEQQAYEQSQPDPRVRGMQKLNDTIRNGKAPLTSDEALAVGEMVQELQDEVARLKAELDLKAKEMAHLPQAVEHSLQLNGITQFRSSPKNKLLTVAATPAVTALWRVGDVLVYGPQRWRLQKKLMTMAVNTIEVSTWKVFLIPSEAAPLGAPASHPAMPPTAPSKKTSDDLLQALGVKN